MTLLIRMVRHQVVFGNGWTNTFDAHMAYNAATK